MCTISEPCVRIVARWRPKNMESNTRTVRGTTAGCIGGTCIHTTGDQGGATITSQIGTTSVGGCTTVIIRCVSRSPWGWVGINGRRSCGIPPVWTRFSKLLVILAKRLPNETPAKSPMRRTQGILSCASYRTKSYDTYNTIRKSRSFEWDDAKSCMSDFRSFLLVANETMERWRMLILASK
jgi:hypothetical protein